MFESMSDAQKRSIRTLIQAAMGAVSAGLLDVLAEAVFGLNFDARLTTSIAVVMTTVLTQVQNTLEESDSHAPIVEAMRKTK